MKLAIRLHTEWTENLIPFFEELDKSVVYEHIADEEVSRTHIHALVETDLSTDTLKIRIRKCLGFKPTRSDWAFSEKVGKPLSPVEDKFITYMSKGNLEPKYLKGFTQDECDRYKALWVEKPRSSIAETDKKDVTCLQIARELHEYINKQATVGYDEVNSRLVIDNISTPMLVERCIDIHNKYNKTYTDHSLVRIIHTSWGMCKSGSKWREKLVQSVVRKLNIDFVL